MIPSCGGGLGGVGSLLAMAELPRALQPSPALLAVRGQSPARSGPRSGPRPSLARPQQRAAQPGRARDRVTRRSLAER